MEQMRLGKRGLAKMKKTKVLKVTTKRFAHIWELLKTGLQGKQRENKKKKKDYIYILTAKTKIIEAENKKKLAKDARRAICFRCSDGNTEKIKQARPQTRSLYHCYAYRLFTEFDKL